MANMVYLGIAFFIMHFIYYIILMYRQHVEIGFCLKKKRFKLTYSL